MVEAGEGDVDTDDLVRQLTVEESASPHGKASV
jgi:hypothetical protein